MQKTFKRHYLHAAAIILIGLVMQGCGSKKEYIIKPQATQVKGILGDYLQVKDGQYKFQKVGDDGKHWSISIPLKRIKKPKHSCDHFNLTIYISLLDSKGQPINIEKPITDFVTYLSGDKKMNDDNNSEDFLSFDMVAESYDKEIKLPDDIASFTVSSDATYQGNGEPAPSLERDFSKPSSSSSDEKSSEETASAGNQDWDKLLKDYEVYTDKYIALMQKVKNKDMSAMSDYQDMLDKAEKLGKDLDKAQSKLSPDQLNKMMQIQTKLSNAAMEMAK